MVLSLKQANVVGRLAALLLPRLTCVAFEHIAEYRARRLQRLYGPLLRLLSTRVDEVWADCGETLEETRRYFPPRRREEARDPPLRRGAKRPLKDRVWTGVSRWLGGRRKASGRARTWRWRSRRWTCSRAEKAWT